MNGSTDQWMHVALAWLDSPQSAQMPALLNDGLATATEEELNEFASLLVSEWDEPQSPIAEHFDGGGEFGGDTEGLQWSDDEDDEETLEPELVSETDDDIEADDGAGKEPASQRRLLRLRALLQRVAARALRLRLERDNNEPLAPSIEPETLAQLALDVADHDPTSAAHCLQVLAAQGDEASLQVLCDLFKRQILSDEHSVAIAMSPLFQWPPMHLPRIFQWLGPDIWKWQLIGPMLDLAGHAFRKGWVKQHPFMGEAPRLRELLAGTVQRLSKLEEDPSQFGDDVNSIQRVLANAVALSVSLCDALGLVGDREAEGKLNQAMLLSHRRIQTEAAGALARLGFTDGKKRLMELAADPLSRQRAVAYADELGMEEDVPADLRSPSAKAEAELVTWLADRDRFGMPPTEMELIDDRIQYWPSYEEPQACWLWKFTYRFPQGELSNIGIAGPLVYAVRADLKQMPLDDIYSLFAGWQAEHEDIYEVPTTHFNTAQRAEADRLLHELSHDGIDEPMAVALTFFFGERALLATGSRDGQSVIAIHDGLENLVVPTSKQATSLTPDLVLSLYRGRKLLRTFN